MPSNPALTSSIKVAGKHLFCEVGAGLVVFPDYAGPMAGRPKIAPIIIELEHSAVSFEICNHHLVFLTLGAFYILDISQFNDPKPPPQLKATMISRFGVIASQGYGRRADDADRGATASVTVTAGAIYETLKIDHQWWVDEDGGNKSSASEPLPVEHCEFADPYGTDGSRSHLRL